MAEFILEPPHSPGQQNLIESTEMDVVFAGRRYGKTHAGTQRILKGAFTKPGLYWWVGLSWRAASMQVAWRQLQKYHDGIMEACKLDSRLYKSLRNYELRFPNGSIIQMRTAENPESLAGEAVDGFIFDEFSMAREAVWTEQLAPTLITTGGWGCFIGVPKGNNWATKLWNYAKRTPGWNKLHFTTLDNPFVTQDAYERIRESMPLMMQQQELLAEVLSGRGQVFRNITNCATAPWYDEPQPRTSYIAGLDWAQDQDYTVVTIVDTRMRQCVHYQRIQKMEYPDQLKVIKGLHDKWGFQTIIAESNAAGKPMVQQMARDGLPVEPFDTNKSTKREIIELLQIAFETENFEIPLDELMIDELESMEMNLTSTGHPQYAAPSGMHDDIVMSLALAHWGIAYNYKI